MTAELKRVRTAARHARDAGARAAVTRRERDLAIVDAYRAGVGTRDIAEAAGLSQQRVAQLVRDAL